HEWRPGIDHRSSRKSRLALDGHLGHAVTKRDVPAAQGFPHNKEGEVKTRLTIGKPAKFRSKAANWQPNKRGPGPFEPRPRRKGQCRVSAPTASAFLLHGLAVQREIETLAFHFAGHAEADDHVDDLKNDQRDHHVIDEDTADADGLIEHLAGIALDQSGGAAVLTDREYAGKQRTGRSSERV